MTKNTGLISIIIAISVFLATGVSAADLRNEDGRRYEVKVYEGSTTRNTWIDASSTVAGICGNCEIEVVGIGKVKLTGSERAVIKNGKLSKR